MGRRKSEISDTDKQLIADGIKEITGLLRDRPEVLGLAMAAAIELGGSAAMAKHGVTDLRDLPTGSVPFGCTNLRFLRNIGIATPALVHVNSEVGEAAILSAIGIENWILDAFQDFPGISSPDPDMVEETGNPNAGTGGGHGVKVTWNPATWGAWLGDKAAGLPKP